MPTVTNDARQAAPKPTQPDWDIKRWLLHFRGDLVPGPIVQGPAIGRNTAGLLAIRSGDSQRAFLVHPDLLRAHISPRAFTSTFSEGTSRTHKRLDGGGARIVDLLGVEGEVLTLFLQYITPEIALKPFVDSFETLEK